MLCAVIGAVAACLAGATSATAGPGAGDLVPPRGSNAAADALLGFAEPTAKLFAQLEAKAEANGTVGVIVMVGDREDAARALQKTGGTSPSQAAKLRSALLKEFEGKKLRGLAMTKTLPLVAFHAQKADLEVLEHSELVAGVALDRVITLSPSELGGEPIGAPPAPEALIAAGADPDGTSANEALSSWWDTWRVGLDRTWKTGWIGTGQTVAILDTGVDGSHDGLRGHVVAEACFARYPNGAGACPNGTSLQYGPGAAAPCGTNCGHGTHVAHTAAGNWGVARGAGVVAVQVFHQEWDARQGGYVPKTSVFEYVRALEYVYSLRNTYRIAAVNMSLGGGGYLGYCDGSAYDASTAYWVYWLKQAGIATVISSGNDGYTNAVSSPGCISHAVSVGATTLDAAGYDAVYAGTQWGSNSNWTLDLLAPGVGVCSAVLANGWGCWGGTSMAAPHVAGAFAVARQYRPAATADQILNALYRSGPAVVDSRNGIARVRINVADMLAYL
jgi:subtilisin family serine protease